MLNSKPFWYFMRIGAIGGWLFSLFGIIYPINNELLYNICIAILLIWSIGHVLELFISISVGKNANISPAKSVIKTLLFGFTWWLPIKKGVLKT